MKQVTTTVKVWPDTYAKLKHWAEAEGITVDELANTLLKFEVSIDHQEEEAAA